MCHPSDGDRWFGHRQSVHRRAGPPAWDIGRLLADGLGAAVVAGRHADDSCRTRPCQVPPVLARREDDCRLWSADCRLLHWALWVFVCFPRLHANECWGDSFLLHKYKMIYSVFFLSSFVCELHKLYLTHWMQEAAQPIWKTFDLEKNQCPTVLELEPLFAWLRSC